MYRATNAKCKSSDPDMQRRKPVGATDVGDAPIDVRFRGVSGHGACMLRCLLLTQSGHSRFTIAAVQLDPKPHFVGRKSLL